MIGKYQDRNFLNPPKTLVIRQEELGAVNHSARDVNRIEQLHSILHAKRRGGLYHFAAQVSDGQLRARCDNPAILVGNVEPPQGERLNQKLTQSE